ncbi:MAG TPA: metalloregulator ArsR/SmtB family transcription factor [Candidatus Paceibacterota bacterium]|uniref:HTH arsR-type domain-containing protein n=1 Tax=Candidatus Adlerbacteria bacterium RIFCSPLOWO2_01_FULL_51_16 TaxID=1797243 RepID=A0A1F4XEK0_9BACT|nr:MAG: hypothetical protein A2943_01580 [Candidatus Adlerbacteria bacterium RIFCSPLOWO2_01_FULL_51_16]HXK31799.1 metalloregulator ArsR/SmtB family transcription factor [Candidatus Paceibacterota bacterium]
MKADVRGVEKVIKALANRRRLLVVKYLHRKGKAAVGDIAEEIKLSFPSTSRHLSILYAADLLEREQTSTTINYSLIQPHHPALRVILSIL